MFKKLIFGLLLLLMVACEPSFQGCGPIVGVNPPEPQYETYVTENGTIRVPNGRFYYPVVVRGDDGENHKVYVSYDTWAYSQKGDIICTH